MSEPTCCSTCKRGPDEGVTHLLPLECPLPDTMGESDGTVCWLCNGEGEIHVCATCFYLGPDESARSLAGLGESAT